MSDIYECSDKKKIYEYILNTVEHGDEKVVIKTEKKDVSREEMKSLIVSAYMNDAEDIFADPNFIYRVYEEEDCFITEYLPNCNELTDYEKYREELTDKLDTICVQFEEFDNDKDKFEAIFSYLRKNCRYDDNLAKKIVDEKYDYDTDYYRSTYGALIHAYTVCSGYAKAFKAISDRLNLPCMVFTGTVEDYGHAWNAVIIDGEPFFIDVTFADTGGGNKFFMMSEKTYKKAGYMPEEQYIPQEFSESGLLEKYKIT